MLNDFCTIAERLAVSSLDISENVGTIHELSLPTVSDYAYLIFGNIYSLSSFLKTIIPFLYISVNPPVAIHGLPTCHWLLIGITCLNIVIDPVRVLTGLAITAYCMATNKNVDKALIIYNFKTNTNIPQRLIVFLLKNFYNIFKLCTL